MNEVKKKEVTDPKQKTHLAKYLMEIKELPTYAPVEEKKNDAPVLPEANPAAMESKKADNQTTALPRNEGVEIDGINDLIEKDDAKNKKVKAAKEIDLRQYSPKDIVLNAVNLIAVIGLIVLLSKLPQKAQELKTLRSDNLHYEQGELSELPDISDSEAKSDKLKGLFLTRAGVIEFVKPLDELKRNGTVTNYAFTREDAVKDKTGSSALPVAIEFRGNDLELLKTDMSKIEHLPFLFRPISVDISPAKEDPTVIVFKYGGFLYVDDKLGQTR